VNSTYVDGDGYSSILNQNRAVSVTSCPITRNPVEDEVAIELKTLRN
jgi:hypothetical protein